MSNLIKASAVKALTGWTDLRTARRNGYVQMIRRRGQIWYRLDSINPAFYVLRPSIPGPRPAMGHISRDTVFHPERPAKSAGTVRTLSRTA